MAYKNTTADKAIGSVDKEIRRMAKLALFLRKGKCNPIWASEQEKQFTGIFKHLLTDQEEDLIKQAGR